MKRLMLAALTLAGLGGYAAGYARGLRDTSNHVAIAYDQVGNLRDLIKHMEIHGNYAYGGYAQMTTEQKELFRVVCGLDDEWERAWQSTAWS